MVASNGNDSEELDDWDDTPFVGWWVGDDGNWHPPDEPFRSQRAVRSRRLRRVVMIVLSLAVIAATSVSVWGGALTSPATAGPSLSELTAQVRQTVTGDIDGESSVARVAGVTCDAPSSWTSGETFTCRVTDSSGGSLGEYDATVLPTASSGGWRWEGVWKPTHPYAVA
jgi:hypothetical protein